MNDSPRRCVAVAGAVAVSPVGSKGPRVDAQPAFVNDVHSRLNRIRVTEIRQVRTLAEVTGAIRQARDQKVPVCIAGGRHAMGAQQFATNAVLLDTRRLNRVLNFNPQQGTIEVEAGMCWPELVRFLLQTQGNREGIWTIAQKQTGANLLSIGGALAANIHGRALRMEPFVGDIEAFTLVNAKGATCRCSRNENADLFRLAVGGYGLFGFVYSVNLRLVRRKMLQRAVDILHIKDLMPAFEQRIADGYLFGDFQYAIDPASDQFLRNGIFSCYRPATEGDCKTAGPKLQLEDWERLIHLAHVDPSQAFREYAKHYLRTSGQCYWSDLHQFTHYVDGYHETLDRRLGNPRPATDVISEIYVPRSALVTFMAETAHDFRRHAVKVIYGTIRLIERDGETFLAWAREPFSCVIFNLCTTHTPEGVEHSANAFRRLIDRAIRHGGSFYLTYHKFATRRQLEACYPQFNEFLREKIRYDPEERFQSDWYRHYREDIPLQERRFGLVRQPESWPRDPFRFKSYGR